VAIKFLLPADTGSNKPEKYSVQSTALAYWHRRPTGYQVAVLKPKLDRLSLTLAVQGSAIRAELRNNLATLAASGGAKISNWKKMGGWGSGKYARSYSLNVSSGFVLVQCADPNSIGSLLRFEFNPSVIGDLGVAAFRQSIPELTAGHFNYQALAAHGRVTRADIAVDLVNIDIEDLLISTSKPGVTNGYFGVAGKAETKYLNVTKSGSNLYVYDRRASLKKAYEAGTAEPSQYGEAKYTRVEVRTEINAPLIGMPSMSNRLLKIDLFDIEAGVPPEEPHHWKMFQDACRYRGLAGALALLPEKMRGAYEAAVTAADKLWRPEELWSHWSEALVSSRRW
jgi:hypothetical protein